MPIGLFNVHGKDTESEHVIAIKQCKWKFSTRVLLLQPRISVPGSTKSMQAGNFQIQTTTGDFTNQKQS